MKDKLAIILAILSLSVSAYLFLAKDAISTDELARATGIIRLEINIPKDLKDDEFLGTAWFDQDEFVRFDNNLQHFEPGSKAVVYLWTHRNANFQKFSILNDSYAGDTQSTVVSDIRPLEGFIYGSRDVGSGSALSEGDSILAMENSDGEERELKIVRKNLSNQLL